MIPLPEQLACVEREIAMRRKVYPRWVAAGRMKPFHAAREIATLEAVIETLRRLPEAVTQKELL